MNSQRILLRIGALSAILIVLAPMPNAPTYAASKPDGQSIVGKWVRESTMPSFIFQEDGTMRVEQAGKRLVTAKYRTDTSKTPHHLDLFDFDNREYTAGANEMAGIFELEGTQRMKMETGKATARPQQFGELAQSGTRVGAAPSSPSIVGEWKQDSVIV